LSSTAVSTVVTARPGEVPIGDDGRRQGRLGFRNWGNLDRERKKTMARVSPGIYRAPWPASSRS
jgi:hypothetical protein